MFLNKHAHIFVWSHEDMPGIDPDVTIYIFNVDPSYKATRRRRQRFNLERYQAIEEEIE